MRLSAACLTLLLLLSLISVVGIERSNAYQLLSHGIFKEVHDAALCAGKIPCECGSNLYCESNRTRTRTFSPDDLWVYVVARYRVEKADVDSPIRIRYEWRDPTGKVIQKNPKSAAGDPHGALGWYGHDEWWYRWKERPEFVNDVAVIFDRLEVRFARTHRPLGLYTVTLFDYEKGELFTEYFGIGHYPVFLKVEGLPQGEYIAYSVDGVERGRVEAGNVSVTSFPIPESHTISTPKTVLSPNQEQFECIDCAHAVSEEATLSFHYSRSVNVATTMTTGVTSQVTTAPTSTAIIPATVTVTAKESVPVDFATLSMVMSVVAISAVAVLAFVVVRRRGNKP